MQIDKTPEPDNYVVMAPPQRKQWGGRGPVPKRPELDRVRSDFNPGGGDLEILISEKDRQRM